MNEYLKKKIKEEGDYKAFEYKGFRCRILRRTVGLNYKSSLIYLCGYVGLPKGHKYYGVRDFINIDTKYGAFGLGNGLLYQPEKNLWWIGFDCGHWCDICKLEEESLNENATYKDMDFVTKELKNLVDKLLTI